jgi:hypothetical protein
MVLIPPNRHDLGRAEIERLLGAPPIGAVRFDPAVPRAQARSRLLSPRAGRAAKDLRALARKIVTGVDGALAKHGSSDGSES